MLRVIGGSLRGKKLFSVPGRTTRPTADRLRESLFNILSRRVESRVVLDLFAGTGALGIEALSRGAQFAVFLDNSREALSVIERNIRSCRLEASARVIRWDIRRNLSCLTSMAGTFDLVLMDPPYNHGLVREALLHLHRSRALKPAAIIVAEHAVEEPMAADPTEFRMTDQRNYGKTVFSFLEYLV